MLTTQPGPSAPSASSPPASVNTTLLEPSTPSATTWAMAQTAEALSAQSPALNPERSESEEVEALLRRRISRRTTPSAAASEAGGAAGRPFPAEEAPTATHDRPPPSRSSATPSSRLVLDEEDELDELEQFDELDASETGVGAASSASAEYDKEVPPLFPATTYTWNLPEGAPSLAKLVEQREEVFAKQRTFDQDDLQQRAYTLLAGKLSSYSRTSGSQYSSYGYYLRGYASFCRSVSVPPWPMFDALCALYLQVAVPSTQKASTRATQGAALRTMSRWFSLPWANVPGYQEMADWPGGQTAAHEWQKLAPTSVSNPRPSTDLFAGNEGRRTPDSDYQSQNGDADQLDAPQGSQKPKRSPCPGVPRVGDTFSSPTHLYKVIIKALIPVKDNTVLSSSIFVHSHGVDRRLAADPGWRPWMRNKDALEALAELSRETAQGDPPPATQTAPSVKRAAEPPEPCSPKRPRLAAEPAPSPSSLDFLPPPAPAAPSKPHADEALSATRPPLSAPPGPPAPANAACATASPPSPAVKPDPDAPLSAHRDSSPFPAKPLIPFRRSLSSRRSLTTDPSLFLPDLTSFLAAADPSLISLAQPLLDAGVASSRYLALLALLEPDSRMAMYEEMEGSAGVELEDEQIALLEQALDELRVEEAQA
ncbi:hypothetical protein JCM6882_008709 [Rhodosporidiobolus microsporus]